MTMPYIPLEKTKVELNFTKLHDLTMVRNVFNDVPKKNIVVYRKVVDPITFDPALLIMFRTNEAWLGYYVPANLYYDFMKSKMTFFDKIKSFLNRQLVKLKLKNV